jgi:tRNA pseudouridine38-40 synthase
MEYGRAWHLHRQLDFEKIRAAAATFVGKHDFAGFAANRGKLEHDTVRTIERVLVRRTGNLGTIEFDGDGFLYKMVRLMVGALIDCAAGKSDIGELVVRLEKKIGAKNRLAAPACGLYLVRVRY